MAKKRSSKAQTFYSILLVVITLAFGAIFCSASDNSIQKVEGKVSITILYDNYVFTEGTKSDWGFSCLIEGTEKVILFDAGADPEILRQNIEKLKIDISAIDLVAVSHTHLDHTGGLSAILDVKPNIEIFIPDTMPQAVLKFKGSPKYNLMESGKPYQLCKGVFLTSVLGDTIKEQALIINTSKGVILITGCAHPGIVNYVKKANELTSKEIYIVLGGFHLLKGSEEELARIAEEMKALGVKKCSASHCTGDKAIEVLRKTFKDNLIESGTGKIITIE